MPRLEKDSVLISPTSKERVTYYLGEETLNRVTSLSEMMKVPKSLIIEKSVSVYTDLVIKERKKNANS
tara:strand:- start:7996 stop:8199 length:204 start_codon:yes stop_codon:yes gene_type:complete